MALIKCTHCGKEINNTRSKCILCGGMIAENKRSKEKKIVEESINTNKEMNTQKKDSVEKKILSEEYSGLRSFRIYLRILSIFASIVIVVMAIYDYEEYFISEYVFGRDSNPDTVSIIYGILLFLTLWTYNSFIQMIDFLFDLEKRTNLKQ